METLGDLIAANARRHPLKTAFVGEEKSYTFQQVDRRTKALAGALAALGAEKGARIGILASNCPQYFEVFGATRAGTICVPLNYRSVGRELSYLINNADVNTLIVGSEFVNVINSIRRELKSIRSFICLDADMDDMLNYEALIESRFDDEPSEQAVAADPCALFYTSGTTGRPKGAIHTHRSMVAEATLPHRDLSAEDVVLCVMPFFHVGGSAANLIPAFAAGATVHIHKRFDETQVLETIEKEKITYTFLVPAMIIRLLEHPAVDRYDLSSLRALGYTGSPMPVEALRRGIERIGEVFFQELGQTETLNMTLLRQEEHMLDGSAERLKRLESVGRPLAEGEIRIVDEQDRDVPAGVTGEIVARTDRIMEGYWKLPQETAEAMRGGWLHTGDVGKMDKGGYIYLVDRKKDMIISGGENIYSREVEEVLYMHPAILEAAVLGVPDDAWGESVKAVVVLRPGTATSEQEVIEFCKARMASYKKPRSVEFWEELPKTASGKIKKIDIRERFWQGHERRIH
jgi:long-chain acyl-CoA synthetase